MLKIKLGGTEYTLRNRIGVRVPAHYAENAFRALCGINLTGQWEDTAAGVKTEEICGDCHRESMKRSATEARAKMEELWGGDAKLVR